MALTQVDQGLLGTYAQYTGFKNRIINGQMVINQRGSSSYTINTDPVYTLDRFSLGQGGNVNSFTVQQSTTVPTTGFRNSMLVTMGTGVTVAAGAYAYLRQAIEGYNVADFNLGSSTASPFTVSFYVRSSVTGTFGVSLRNGGSTATYCATYTINAASTWEYKTVTIPAITSGTWTTDNTAGLELYFDLGVGSTYSGTANQLNTGANYFGVTGTTKLAATTGATFYITGVQLEKGSTATSFDYRPYGTELQLCQRYYENNYPSGTAVAAGSMQSYQITQTICTTNGYLTGNILWKTIKRANPTVVFYNYNGTINSWYQGKQGQTENAYTPANVNGSPYQVYWSNSGINTDSNVHYGMITASSEL